MPFNINEFSSKIGEYGGLARPNAFEVEFTPMRVNGFPNTIQSRNPTLANLNTKFLCQTVTFPSLIIETFEYRPNNNDISQSMPQAIGHGDLECVFMVDDQHKMAEFFHTWFRLVTNYSDSTFGDQMQYELGYKSDYACGMSIRMFSRSPVQGGGGVGNSFYQCYLKDVFPVQIGSINLEWAMNDSYMTLPVSFSYSSYTMQRYRNGIVVDDSFESAIKSPLKITEEVNKTLQNTRR